MTAREKKSPVPGHKCLGVTRWVCVSCQCGWSSDMLRQSETAAVYDQWRRHVAKCPEAQSHGA